MTLFAAYSLCHCKYGFSSYQCLLNVEAKRLPGHEARVQNDTKKTTKLVKHMVSCHATHFVYLVYESGRELCSSYGSNLRSWFNSVRLRHSRTVGTFQPLDHSLYNKWNEKKKVTLEHAHPTTPTTTDDHMKTCNQDYCYLFWFVPRLEFVFSLEVSCAWINVILHVQFFSLLIFVFLSFFWRVFLGRCCPMNRKEQWIYCYRSYSLIISELEIVHNSWHGIKIETRHAEKRHQSEWLMDFV